jgi:hypothetical protein
MSTDGGEASLRRGGSSGDRRRDEGIEELDRQGSVSGRAHPEMDGLCWEVERRRAGEEEEDEEEELSPPPQVAVDASSWWGDGRTGRT